MLCFDFIVFFTSRKIEYKKSTQYDNSKLIINGDILKFNGLL